MFKVKIFLIGLVKKMWPKVTAFALLGVASAFLAVLLRNRIPDDIAYPIAQETVGTILNILASSMLAVTTFSLTVMVSAYSSATTTVSPRATQLVVQDHTAQNVLSTFLGTFLFSLVGIIALNANVYQDKGRVVLFITTLLVVVIMVIALIRWIDRLTKIGRVGETTRLVEEAATKSLKQRAEAPCLGCNRLDYSEVAWPVKHDVAAPEFGYVQFIDTEDLGKIADANDCDIHVLAVPGRYVTPKTALARTSKQVDGDVETKIRKAFTVAGERAFEQDPRFGICVLAEIAVRALPPTTNDPGTAIDVLGRLVSALAAFVQNREEVVKCKRVWVPPLDIDDLFNDAFGTIAHDSANMLSVQVRLQKCLHYLHELDVDEYRENAVKYSRLALMYTDRSNLLDMQKQELRDLALRG